jgi:hypothetical protein
MILRRERCIYHWELQSADQYFCKCVDVERESVIDGREDDTKQEGYGL